MARFPVTYHGSEMSHDPESMARAREAFMQWAEKTGGALLDPGSPVKSTKTVSSGGTQDGSAAGPFSGWSVIEAVDAEAARDALEDHPFVSRGGVLQVSEPVEF